MEKNLKNKNILIAEDDDFNYIVLSEMLYDTKALCYRASDGVEAVNKAINDKYDLILMDINLPKLDGMSAIKKIREKNNEIPIIVLTAYAYNERLRAEKGYNEFLVKPFEFDVVLSLVSKYI